MRFGRRFRAFGSLRQEVCDCTMKFSRNGGSGLIDDALQERGALNQVASVDLGRFEATEEVGVIGPPVIGVLACVVELALRFV